MSPACPEVAIVLPGGERFSSMAAGAIALQVHRMAGARSRYERLVLGQACAAPFADVAFRGVRPALLPARFAWRYATAVAGEVGRARLIEVHNRADVASALALRLPAARVTLFLHNDPASMRGLGRWRRRRTARRLRGFVCVSAFLAGRLRALLPDADISVVPNAFERTPPGGERERVILFVGRIVADKGADAFVAACAELLPRLPGWRAEMIGADRFGADSPETPFLRGVRARAAQAGVTLAGFLPHDAVLAAMARAAIVAVPSRWPEPFGLTALEAMASGCALVCSGRGGLAEVVGEAALGCDPDRPETLAAALFDLASRPDERAARAAAGLRQAARFDTALVAARLDGWRARMLGDDAEN